LRPFARNVSTYHLPIFQKNPQRVHVLFALAKKNQKP
jgi:hypothetical protein